MWRARVLQALLVHTHSQLAISLVQFKYIPVRIPGIICMYVSDQMLYIIVLHFSSVTSRSLSLSFSRLSLSAVFFSVALERTVLAPQIRCYFSLFRFLFVRFFCVLFFCYFSFVLFYDSIFAFLSVGLLFTVFTVFRHPFATCTHEWVLRRNLFLVLFACDKIPLTDAWEC